MPGSMLDPRRRGSARSLTNLAILRDLKTAGVFGVRTSRAVADLQWQPAAGHPIRLGSRIWHAGHVSSILADGGIVIIGTQTGGVWIVNAFPQSFPITNSYPAECASDDWNNPDVSCLAYAPGRTDQFFVGCSDGGDLYLVELSNQSGGARFKQATRLAGC